MEGSAEDSGHGKHGNLHHTTLESKSGIAAKTPLPPLMDQSENTASYLAVVNDLNQTNHLIDMSAYIAPVIDERTEHLMSVSITNQHDPFDVDSRASILNNLSTPLHHYDSYNSIDEPLPHVKKGNMLSLGKKIVNIIL